MAGHVATELSQPSSKIIEELVIDFTYFKAEYVTEFQQLETFLERNPLSVEEAEQYGMIMIKIVTVSFLATVFECADISRVILWCKKTIDDNGSTNPLQNYNAKIITFADDFIHASYVRGRPLLNTFILTQAPLPSTINDFWQMVWQERSKYIIMLCKPVDTKLARLSPTATIIHCLDGCGRSGTLVTIEVLLMHLLRDSAQYDKLVLTTAMFARLQRRHAISSPLQYLFIYRTLLHSMQPFIVSNIARFILGLIFSDWGFIGKYQKMISCRHRFE
ncbi:unnamed protein product [Acanthocheilonema viteae]|uniref:Tyrosine-protein phosphatase domain-containing protein n=1 Tax=Acanthocheilonema viteae TaxID=6277 RepID=A0A498SJZ5_ACAVI|nr:unnamed protein product [Acanthocheilonema viteae]